MLDIGINIFNNTVESSSGITPPLDDYTGAQTAYSIARKLRTAYTGDAIRVRESSGDTEADIGFDSNGDLDETALLAHTGSNSGYIVTAYDQSGNGNDWTQSTASDQPRIVNAGTIEKDNGKPVFLIVDTSDHLDCLNNGLTSSTATAFIVMNTGTSTIGKILQSTNSGVYVSNYQSGSSSTAVDSFASSTAFFNGTQRTTNTKGETYTLLNQAQCLISFTSLDVSNGNWDNLQTQIQTKKHQELIIFNSDKSSDRSAIETNINDYYSIY